MRPTRRTALGLIGGAAVALPAAARPAYEVEPVRVADGLWMVEGAREYFSMENGGAIVNVALLETGAGVVVVDTGSSRDHGAAIRQAALQATGRGVAAAIVTHHHPDHYFGNQAFEGVPVHALGETAALAWSHGDAYADNMYRLLGDWMRGTEPVPPDRVLTGGRLEIGGRALELMPLGGHTEADLVLIDVATGVLIAGDLAFLDRAPTTPDADLARWRESLGTLDRLEAAAVLPGHGPFDPGGASLRQTRAYLDWLEETLVAAAGRGLDMVEAMAIPLPGAFAAMGAQPREFERSVTHLYPAIETAALPLLE